MPEKILIVEDEPALQETLAYNLSRQGYLVETVGDGLTAIASVRKNQPDLVVLDIMLPDIDGFEVCRILRTNTRTSHVPVIFLTQKDERSDKLAGLELGADDYVTKPFDIEELRLRVQRAITRAEQQSLTDPRSGLPAGRLIEEQLRRIIRQKNWAYMDVKINQFEPFKETYGFVAGDDVLRFTSMLIGEVLDELGTASDFIGHAGGDSFVIVTAAEVASAVRGRLRRRFADEVLSHYNFLDREQGFIRAVNKDGQIEQSALMKLAIGIVTPEEYQFADIREITELAAEARRRDN